MTQITGFRGNHRFLSNFYPSQVGFEGLSCRTVEHAYQAAKARNESDRAYIASAFSAGEAKRRGQNLDFRPDWEEVKLEIMEGLVRVKFADPTLAVRLRDTGDAELIEGNTWGDTFWGVCNGVGENHLGKILMRIRTELGG